MITGQSMTMRLLAVASSVFFAGCSVFGHSNVKTPDYQVVQKDGDFEIRQYPQLTLVVAESGGTESQARRRNFKQLFDYIKGNNAAKQQYEMTAPVLMQPVAGQRYQMAFVLPQGVSQPPASTGLTTQVLRDARFAAYRFSGKLTPERSEDAHKQVLAWLAKQQITAPQQTFYSAGYNAPWTINAFKTNDVLVPLSNDSLIQPTP